MLHRVLTTARWLSLAVLFFWTTTTYAASFNVFPVRVELSPENKSAALTVKNDGNASVVVQLKVVDWSQHDGQDSYSPSKELLATPPIFTVASGAEQIIRVGLRRLSETHSERAYRLFIQEIPGPPKQGFQGVQIALRIGIPVFVKGKSAVAPDLKWRAERQGGDTIKLIASNLGNAHIQVADFRVSKPNDDKLIANQPVSAYLLPGKSKEWLLKAETDLAVGEEIRLKAYTDAGELDINLALEHP